MMTRSNRLNPVAGLRLVGLLGASLAACTGTIAGQPSGTGGSSNGTGTGGSSNGTGTGGSSNGTGTGGSSNGTGTGGSSNGTGTGGSSNGNGSGGSGNGSGSGGDTSSGTDGGTPSASVGQSNIIACVNGIAATTQIPRMTDAQYDNVDQRPAGRHGADVERSNQPPSALLVAGLGGQPGRPSGGTAT